VDRVEGGGDERKRLACEGWWAAVKAAGRLPKPGKATAAGA
jgi:hypothetical protein